MSRYITFFIKGGKRFFPLGSYSASSPLAEAFYAEEGKLKPLKKKEFNDITKRIEEEKISIGKTLSDYAAQINFIKSLKNSVEDKLAAFSAVNDEIKEIQERANEANFALDFCTFLENIFYDDMFYEDLDKDHYIYYGIEVSEKSPIEEEE